jgi:hypothetical protein
MKVSKQFLKDFALIANHYKWTPEDVEQVKEDTRANPDLVNYWTVLAAAIRAGYEQTQENGYIRLRDWSEQQGFGDPFTTENWRPGHA